VIPRALARLAAIVALAVAVAACGGPAPSSSAVPSSPGASGPVTATAAPSSAASGEVQVYAASSLKGVLVKLKEAFEAANPGVVVTASTDASSALATRIEQGAPADVFLAADTRNPQELVDGGFAAGAMSVFAGNHLAVIVPADSPIAIATPADLAAGGVKIIAAADGVPIAAYTAALVANLAREPGYPKDFAAKVAANVVSREDNVGAIVAKVALGEGDAGIVYATDAVGNTRIRSVAIPDSANVEARYGAVVVQGSTNAATAAAFLAWLTSADAQAILAEFGFLQVA